jgi:uncharacterized membrane protein (DUF2068 family)
VLALALGWLAIGGFGNALVWRGAAASLQVPDSSRPAQFVAALSSPLFTGIALAYGATALLACIGIWRMRPWMATAFAVWGAVVTLMGVWLVTALPGDLLAGGVFVGIAFVVGCVALLWVGYRYVRRIAPRSAL